MRAGTVFEVSAVFDNGAGNPNNPSSPPKTVERGDQTTDEILFGFIRATSDTLGSTSKVKPLLAKSDYAPAK